MKTPSRLLAIAYLFSLSGLLADPVADEIELALKNYGDGNLSEASIALTQASNLITEIKTKTVEGVIPETLGGWTGGEINNQSAAAGIFGGGGISISRSYKKDKLSAQITASADSPALNQLTAMMSNPQYAVAAGLKMHRIGSEKAMINAKEGSATLSYKGRFLIQISGRGLDEETLLLLLGAVNLSAFDELR